MTTNILLNETGTEPIRTDDEYFILKRNDIQYRILLESKTQYTGEGYIILTTNRLVIMPTRQNTHFKAIEIPLNKIYQEEFKQPLFGKNYLTAKCSPIFSSQFGSFTFTIWFKGNRMGTLIGAFYTLLDSLRNNQGKNHDENIIKILKENNINELFAIDPEDNSFIYQIQPPSANIPKQNYQSVIINRPPDMNNLNNFERKNNNNNLNENNNNINNNFSELNEEQIKKNNDIYLSTFIYRNPNNINNPNKFVYKDPGFVYKHPNNNNNIRINNNNNDEDDLVSPYIPKEKNNRINNNININYNNNYSNYYNNNYINNYNNNRNNNLAINNLYISNNNQNNINNDDRNNNLELNNPYLPKNNPNNINIQSQLQLQNNIQNYGNNLSLNYQINRSYLPQNRIVINQNSLNNQNIQKIENNMTSLKDNDNQNIQKGDNNMNVPRNNDNQNNNPYSQIMNNPINNEDKNIHNNIQNKNVNTGSLPKGYQNLKEENDNENILYDESNSIYASNYGGIDSSRIHLENNKNDNILEKLNSDELIPDSNVEDPYA